MPSYLTTETSFNWIKINFFAKFSFSLLTSVNFSNILLIGSLFIVIPGKPTDDGFPPITPPLFLNPESRQAPGLFFICERKNERTQFMKIRILNRSRGSHQRVRMRVTKNDRERRRKKGFFLPQHELLFLENHHCKGVVSR